MNHQTLLTNYLSNLQVDLFMVNYHRCDTDWRDLDQISFINAPVMVKLSAILAYIDSNIEENISVQDLA